MFYNLENINSRPVPFEFYTTHTLWTDEHISKHMLAFHLNTDIDAASRNLAFIDRSADWIHHHFHVDNSTMIIDFGCGPGLYTSRLARISDHVTGIDFSTRSIQYAEAYATKENLNIVYLNNDYLQFESSDHFDLALMIMCDYCVLSPTQRKRLLSIFHTILAPDGAVLMDMYSLNAYDLRNEQTIYQENLMDGFWSPHKYYGFLNTFKYNDEKVILDKYTVVDANQTRTIYNWLQYFSLEDITQELNQNGFIIDSLFSDVSGAPYYPDNPEFAVVARKKPSPP